MKHIISNLKLIFKNLRKDLFCILIFCLGFIFLFDFYFINVPEIFTGANKVGNIFYKICLSYIAAYIFYFLNIYIKNQIDKREVNVYVTRLVSLITAEAYFMLSDLTRSSDVKIKKGFPDKDEIILITRKIIIKENFPLNAVSGSSATWPDYFNYRKLKTEGYISKIFTRSNYIDPELIGIISKIEDSMFFLHIDYKTVWEKNSPDLSIISASLFEYFMLIRELEEFQRKNLKIYSKK